MTTPGSRQVVVAAAALTAVLGSLNAAVSFYWAFGGTALLHTIGGDLERWGREGGAGVVIALCLIGLLKLAVALAAPVLAGVWSQRLPAWTGGRIPRRLGWVAAVVLALYGLVLTVAGLLVQSGAIDASADADSTALAWHAYLWDPWFAIWGLTFIAVLWGTRPRGGDGDRVTATMPPSACQTVPRHERTEIGSETRRP